MPRLTPPLILSGLLALAGAASAQQAPQTSTQPEVTFRVDIEYVEVDVIVTDERGHIVTGLTAADFEVLEDRTPQEISSFTHVEIPIERSLPVVADPLTEPDVRTNEQPFEGRLYIVVLDDLHTHPLRSSQVRSAAREFLSRAFHDGDLAAIVYTSGRMDAGQELTSSRRLLLAAIDRFMGRKIRSATLERLDQYRHERDYRSFDEEPQAIDRLRDPLEFQRSFNARRSLGTIKGVAEWLTDIRGRRKSLVFFSEGIDYDIHDIFESRSASLIMDEVRDAIAAATRGGVNIYGLDPRGLGALGIESMEVGGVPTEAALDLGPRSLMREVQLSQDSLRVLADNTGGFAAVNMNDLTGAFDRIVQENSSYYLLGYYPTNTARDGRFRRIDVRVTRPGLRVRAREGYVAPSSRTPERPAIETGEGTSAELRAAIESPLPVTGLTLRAFAAPFMAGARASVTLGIEIDGSRLTFTERDGIFENDLEVSIVAFDHEGNVRAGDRHEVQLRLRPETRQAVVEDGFRFVGSVELPPGRYQVRVAARESGGGLVGSVRHDVDVPDFRQPALAMSGIMLTSTRAPLTPTARQEGAAMPDVLPAPPTAERVFTPGDTLALYAEIYDNPSPAHEVEIETLIRAEDGRAIFSSRDQRQSAELEGRRGGYGHSLQIPLADLTPGRYILRVEAVSRLDRDSPAAREIPFRIVEEP